MSENAASLFDYDVQYYEYSPNFWLPGKPVPECVFGYISRRAVGEAVTLELRDSDVMLAAYMKTGTREHGYLIRTVRVREQYGDCATTFHRTSRQRQRRVVCGDWTVPCAQRH